MHLDTFPLISIVITTYNRSVYLKETLSSISNQSYNNIEVLLIDDGSNVEIAEQNKSICALFANCTYYYKPNTGQPDSRNYGIYRAKGEFIAFCDDDDYWLLDKLEKQVAVLITHPEVGLVTGNIEFVGTDGIRTGRVIRQSGNHGYVFKEFLLKNRTSSITPLLRKIVFDKVGYFNSSFTIYEDWEYWRRVAYYYPFYAIPDVLAVVRKHDKNITAAVTTDPFDQFVRYRELTKALLVWGEGRFTKVDRRLITKVEAKRYKQLMRNHCPGIMTKLAMFFKIFKDDIVEGIRFGYIILKF